MTDKISPADMFSDEPPVKKTPDLSPKVYEQVEVSEAPADDYVEPATGNLIDLPSRGKLGYPSTISHREIMAGDEEILKSSTNKNFSRTVNGVLKSICNDPEFFDEMYIGDRDYALIHIWANTYESEKEFEVRCRHCNHKEEKTIDIFDLKTDPVKEDIRPRFPIKIKKTGDTLNLRLVNVRDDNNAEKFLAENPDYDASMETVHYALAIEFGRPMSTKERVEYVKTNVSAKEFGIIREFHRYFQFGLDTTFEHTCSECKGVTRGTVPFHPEDVIAPEVRTDFEQLLRAE